MFNSMNKNLALASMIALFCIHCFCNQTLHAQTPTFSVRVPSHTISSSGGTYRIFVNSNVDWSAKSNVSWMQVNPDKGNPKDTVVSLTFSPNNTQRIPAQNQAALTFLFGTAMFPIGFLQEFSNNNGSGSGTTSVTIENSANNIVVAPNPSDGNIAITLPIQNYGAAHVKVFSSLGTLLYESSNRIDNNQILINLSALQVGSYILEISVQQHHFSKRFVIIR